MRGNFSALAGLIILGLCRPYVSFSGGFQAVSGLIILIIPGTRPSPGTKAGQESKVYIKKAACVTIDSVNRARMAIDVPRTDVIER